MSMFNIHEFSVLTKHFFCFTILQNCDKS